MQLFNMIPHEERRYSTGKHLTYTSKRSRLTLVAVKEHMKQKGNYEMSSQAIGACQSLILIIGLFGALSLGVYQCAYQGKSVGMFLTLILYWGQLQSR